MKNHREFKCQVCGKDQNDRSAYQKITKICRDNDMGSMCNPGGREFHHPIWGRKQVGDCCSPCDLEELKKWLSEQEKKNAGIDI